MESITEQSFHEVLSLFIWTIIHLYFPSFLYLEIISEFIFKCLLAKFSKVLCADKCKTCIIWENWNKED